MADMSSDVPTKRSSIQFSTRTEWERVPTDLARRHADLGAQYDLTVSNPTSSGFAYPAGAILQAIARSESLTYVPEPRGIEFARGVVGKRLGIDADRIVLSAGTSEAYAWLFKLLCDGQSDQILIPSPSYPLFDYVAQLEGVGVERYPLAYEGERWVLHLDDLARAADACPRPKVVIVVQPNNPTGSALDRGEIAALDSFCAERGLAIISDEVFIDYPFEDAAPIPSFCRGTECRTLTFVLGGLSKAAALPQMKLSWIATLGPSPACSEALERLEIIGDTFLSVGTPVQLGIDGLLVAGEDLCGQIRARVRANRAVTRRMGREAGAAWDVLGGEGGWYAVLRLPRVRTEEEWAIELLEKDHVYVHPGYLFDFEGDGYLVVSLLPEERAFTEGMRRISARIARRIGER
jgi:alanine-synthesizing transaminase